MLICSGLSGANGVGEESGRGGGSSVNGQAQISSLTFNRKKYYENQKGTGVSITILSD